MDALMLDGNAVAGLLQEVLAVERVVMRCPDCDEVMVTIVKGDASISIGFVGVRMLQVAV